MVSVSEDLSKVQPVHALDHVSTEQVSDVISRKEIDAALKLQHKVQMLRQAQMKSALEIGEALKMVRDNRWFKIYGYDSFESWISSSEIDIEKTTAYRYIRIIEVWVLSGAFTKDEVYQFSVSKMDMLSDRVSPNEKKWVTRKKEIMGLLELRRSDLALELNRQAKEGRFAVPAITESVQTKDTVTDAQFEDISAAKKNSTEVSAKQKDEDALFDEAVKQSKGTVEERKVVSLADVKKEFALSGWYQLVPVEPETPPTGKTFKSVSIHMSTMVKHGQDIFVDIE